MLVDYSRNIDSLYTQASCTINNLSSSYICLLSAISLRKAYVENKVLSSKRWLNMRRCVRRLFGSSYYLHFFFKQQLWPLLDGKTLFWRRTIHICVFMLSFTVTSTFSFSLVFNIIWFYFWHQKPVDKTSLKTRNKPMRAPLKAVKNTFSWKGYV